MDVAKAEDGILQLRELLLVEVPPDSIGGNDDFV
jgi:hypothetical protein